MRTSWGQYGDRRGAVPAWNRPLRFDSERRFARRALIRTPVVRKVFEIDVKSPYYSFKGVKQRWRDLCNGFPCEREGAGRARSLLASDRHQGAAPGGGESPEETMNFGPPQSAGLSSQWAESILDALPDAVLATDREGRILWANRVFLRIFGYSPAFLREQRATVIAGPYATEAEGRVLSEVVARGSGSFDLTAFNQEGVSFPSLIRVRVPESDPDLRLVVVTDTSERERLRAELVVKAEAAQREKEMLRSTAESIAEGVLVADDSERIVLINTAASRLLGLSAAEVNGRPLASVELPGTLRGHWLAFLAGSRKIDARGLEVEIGGESRQIQVQLAKVRSVRGLPLGSVVVLAEEGLGEREAGEGEAFLEALCHELRTPLASIQGFVATLLNDEELDADLRREFYGIIRKDAQRLSHLLENLIEISRLQAGPLILERDSVDLKGLLLESVHQICEEESLDPQRLRVDLPRGPVIASVDRKRVQTVLKELVRNAVEHGWSERGVSIRLKVDAGAATTEVRDWGQGLPSGAEEAFSRVSSHFYRQSGTATAAGLGLALCRKVAEKHAGDLRVETPEDGGVQVALRLPL